MLQVCQTLSFIHIVDSTNEWVPLHKLNKTYSVYPISFHDLNFPFQLPKDSIIINSKSNGIKNTEDGTMLSKSISNAKSSPTSTSNSTHSTSNNNTNAKNSPISTTNTKIPSHPNNTPSMNDIISGIASMMDQTNTYESFGIPSNEEEPIEDVHEYQEYSQSNGQFPGKDVSVLYPQIKIKNDAKRKLRSADNTPEMTKESSPTSHSTNTTTNNNKGRKNQKGKKKGKEDSLSHQNIISMIHKVSITPEEETNPDFIPLSHFIANYNTVVLKELDGIKTIPIRKRRSPGSSTNLNDMTSSSELERFYLENDNNIKRVENVLKLMCDIRREAKSMFPNQKRGGCQRREIPRGDYNQRSVLCLYELLVFYYF